LHLLLGSIGWPADLAQNTSLCARQPPRTTTVKTEHNGGSARVLSGLLHHSAWCQLSMEPVPWSSRMGRDQPGRRPRWGVRDAGYERPRHRWPDAPWA